MIERTAHAKINLALHVTGQREDGYHLLDSLVVFTSIGDIIRIENSGKQGAPIELSTDGPFSHSVPGDDDNLVKKAASLLYDVESKSLHKPDPVSITLTKNLPVASGIGGGSADAAATLLGLKELWDSPVDLVPIANRLGADVAMCLHSVPLRARGIGEDLTPLSLTEPLNLVLINPQVEVSTPAIFKALPNKHNTPVAAIEIDSLPPVRNLAELRNDLQETARGIKPEIEAVIASITKSGALLTRMSGSGATCFGIYATDADAKAACADISSRNPGWWCVATRTTVS